MRQEKCCDYIDIWEKWKRTPCFCLFNFSNFVYFFVIFLSFSNFPLDLVLPIGLLAYHHCLLLYSNAHRLISPPGGLDCCVKSQEPCIHPKRVLMLQLIWFVFPYSEFFVSTNKSCSFPLKGPHILADSSAENRNCVWIPIIMCCALLSLLFWFIAPTMFGLLKAVILTWFTLYFYVQFILYNLFYRVLLWFHAHFHHIK